MTAAAGPAPQITAVIPTYRRPRFLRRAVSSALAQRGVPLHVCIYDNASGDETAPVAKALAASDTRVRYHCHATNIGAAANFEFGLRQVDTPFFSILSDDDYLLPGFYEHAMAGFEAHPEAMFWAGITINVSEDGVVWDARVERWPREGVFLPPDGFMQMTGGMAPAWTGIVFRCDVLELEGLPDADVLGSADMDYCLRLAARFPYFVEKHPSAVFTLNPVSFSATQPLSSFWPGWKCMLEKWDSSEWLAGDARATAVGALRRDAQRMLFRRGANAIAEGRLDFARQAASALDNDCGRKTLALILQTVTRACAHSSILQRAYTVAYRMAERRIVRSRSGLQRKYGHLLQPM